MDYGAYHDAMRLDNTHGHVRQSARSINHALIPGSLAAEVALLYPALLDILYHITDNDRDLREHRRQAMQTHPARRVGCEDDAVLRHAVVHENLHGHQRRPAAGHLRVEDEHALMAGNIARQLVVVQLRLPRPYVRLDEDTT